ncbi:MAG: helix-turn-helix domain-containing protein [Anaerocolumna sp.]
MLKTKKTKFGKMINIALIENNKTQKELAQEAGLTQVYVYKLLKGGYMPSAKTLYSISKSTSISMDELAKALFDED